ncbi:MAG: hypothetical protein WBW04_03090 [Nitrolancea sp.]
MNAEQAGERQVVETLLKVAGIPVPDAEIDKLVKMYSGSAAARTALRSPILDESEPVTVFAPNEEVGDA